MRGKGLGGGSRALGVGNGGENGQKGLRDCRMTTTYYVTPGSSTRSGLKHLTRRFEPGFESSFESGFESGFDLGLSQGLNQGLNHD